MKKIITLALVLFVTATASAQLRLPTIFSDQMCLQQQQSNAVWGWATPGEKITVKASWGKEVTATADDDGKWKLFLPTPKFTTGQTLTISGKEDKIKLKDVVQVIE